MALEQWRIAQLREMLTERIVELDARIAVEASEIERIKAEAADAVRAAQARKAKLETVRAYVAAHPEVVTLLAALSEAGIKVVE